MVAPSQIPFQSDPGLKLCKNDRIDVGSDGLKMGDFIYTPIRLNYFVFSRNLAMIFLRLLHQTVVLEIKSFFTMHTHLLERFHGS